MSRKIPQFIIMTVLLVGCNRPQSTAKILPSETLLPVPETDTPLPISPEPVESTSTTTPDTTVTMEPEVDFTQEVPVGPTPDMTQVLSGKPIPIYPAGKDITLLEIHMKDELRGWAIAVGNTETEHILITADGGETWQDVSPPQPLPDSGQDISANAGIWDASTAWVTYTGTDLVWTTLDGGKTWDPALLTYNGWLGAMFHVFDQNIIWLFQYLDGGMQKVNTALYRSTDKGETWELMMDPTTGINIQSFDKTGAYFISEEYGWVTRDFRGVKPLVHLDLTQDGGISWVEVPITPPPDNPELFVSGACGLYDPMLWDADTGSFRLSCRYFEGDQIQKAEYFYQTEDGSATWDIFDHPGGKIVYLNQTDHYALDREIYFSDDGGVTWSYVKSVNWDGQFSFINPNTAWAVAYDPVDEEYALVKTTNGCKTFIEIKPELITSSTRR